LETFGSESEKQFASYLITEILKSLKNDELSEYDRMTAFVRKAVESSRNQQNGVDGDENLAL